MSTSTRLDVCPGCQTVSHEECLRELGRGGCATLGCSHGPADHPPWPRSSAVGARETPRVEEARERGRNLGSALTSLVCAGGLVWACASAPKLSQLESVGGVVLLLVLLLAAAFFFRSAAKPRPGD